MARATVFASPDEHSFVTPSGRITRQRSTGVLFTKEEQIPRGARDDNVRGTAVDSVQSVSSGIPGLSRHEGSGAAKAAYCRALQNSAALFAERSVIFAPNVRNQPAPPLTLKSGVRRAPQAKPH